MDDAVRELAREAGIANDWIDAADKPQRVSIETLRSILAALELALRNESRHRGKPRASARTGGTLAYILHRDGRQCHSASGIACRRSG